MISTRVNTIKLVRVACSSLKLGAYKQSLYFTSLLYFYVFEIKFND